MVQDEPIRFPPSPSHAQVANERWSSPFGVQLDLIFNKAQKMRSALLKISRRRFQRKVPPFCMGEGFLAGLSQNLRF